VAREHRIAQLRQAVRNKLANQGRGLATAQDGETGVVQVAPVCADRLLQGVACPLAKDAWKVAHIVVDEVTAARKRVRTSKLLYDLRGEVA
jgi:hypothetical protein